MYEKETSEAIGILKSMISMPSFSREEKAVADFLENFVAGKGFVPVRIENNILLYSTNFDEKRKTFLLNSHIDTVKPVSAWNFDPFTPIEKEEKLFGLGSNDAGASVVTLLEAFFITASIQAQVGRSKSEHLLYQPSR